MACTGLGFFASLRDYTIHRLGDERANEIWGDRLFETTEAYADEWFLAQLERVAAVAGEPATETERAFGMFAAERTFAVLFPDYYSESGDTRAFLLGVEEKIHELVRATVPGARPPRLHIQPLGELGRTRLLHLGASPLPATRGSCWEPPRTTATGSNSTSSSACTAATRAASSR